MFVGQHFNTNTNINPASYSTPSFPEGNVMHEQNCLNQPALSAGIATYITLNLPNPNPSLVDHPVVVRITRQKRARKLPITSPSTWPPKRLGRRAGHRAWSTAMMHQPHDLNPTPTHIPNADVVCCTTSLYHIANSPEPPPASPCRVLHIYLITVIVFNASHISLRIPEFPTTVYNAPCCAEPRRYDLSLSLSLNWTFLLWAESCIAIRTDPLPF